MAWVLLLVLELLLLFALAHLCFVYSTAVAVHPPLSLPSPAYVLYAYSDPLVAASRRRGPGIAVIDGDSFTDLCTLPMDTPVAGLAVDHRDKCFAVVDIHSGCARLFEV